MSPQPPERSWFDLAAPWAAEFHADDTREFSRIWQGFMTARFTLGLVLMDMQVSLFASAPRTVPGWYQSVWHILVAR